MWGLGHVCTSPPAAPLLSLVVPTHGGVCRWGSLRVPGCLTWIQGETLDRTWRAESWGDEIRPHTRGLAPAWHFTRAAELSTVDFLLDMSPSPRFPTREAYLGRGKGQLHSFAGQLPLRMTFQGPTPWATTSGRNPSALTLPAQQKGRANPHAFI